MDDKFYPSLIILTLSAPLIVMMFAVVNVHRRKRRVSPFTENILRLPGTTLRSQHEQLTIDMLLSLMLYAFGVAFIAYTFDPANVVFLAANGVVFIILVVYGAKMYRSIKQLPALFLGMDGEEYTGQELNLLARHGAWVFHDVPYKYGNIDHIVIGPESIFAIETKAVSKPVTEKGKQAQVRQKGNRLVFPHMTTTKPIEQAKCHADHIAKMVKKNTGVDVPVISVVALPGWYVRHDKASDVLLINPKRGKALDKWVRSDTKPTPGIEQATRYIANVARSGVISSKRNDYGMTDEAWETLQRDSSGLN